MSQQIKERYQRMFKKDWGKCKTCKKILVVPSWTFCEFCDTAYQKSFKSRVRREKLRIRNSIRLKKVLAKMKKDGISFRKACSRLRLKLCYDKLLTFKNRNKNIVL